VKERVPLVQAPDKQTPPGGDNRPDGVGELMATIQQPPMGRIQITKVRG
jgi:hypothetical protein